MALGEEHSAWGGGAWAKLVLGGVARGSRKARRSASSGAGKGANISSAPQNRNRARNQGLMTQDFVPGAIWLPELDSNQ